MNTKYFFLAMPSDDLKLFDKGLFGIVKEKDLINYRIDLGDIVDGKILVKFGIDEEDKNYNKVRLFIKSFNFKPLTGHEDIYNNL